MNDTETLAADLYHALGWSGCDGSRWEHVTEPNRRKWLVMAADLTPWLAARVAAARADAWDEGYSEGRLDESINSETDNPYAAPVLPAAAATEGDTP